MVPILMRPDFRAAAVTTPPEPETQSLSRKYKMWEKKLKNLEIKNLVRTILLLYIDSVTRWRRWWPIHNRNPDQYLQPKLITERMGTGNGLRDLWDNTDHPVHTDFTWMPTIADHMLFKNKIKQA